MVVLNYTGGEINAKIVYYGPGLSGKTTNLEYIHEKTPVGSRGKMVSMKTQTDRTLFFDFLPLELGEIGGYRTRFLLYTVPGQVYYNATRKLVLKGVDAVVFVADSSRSKLEENLESLRNLETNLNEHGMSLDELPWVIQYNKRDAADALSVRDLDARLNPLRVQTFEAVATQGTGVYETFHGIAALMFRVLKERLERGELDGEAVTADSGAAAAAPAAVPAKPESAPERASAPGAKPGAHADGELEFDSAIDSMLREVDAPARAAATGATAAGELVAAAAPATGGARGVTHAAVNPGAATPPAPSLPGAGTTGPARVAGAGNAAPVASTPSVQGRDVNTTVNATRFPSGTPPVPAPRTRESSAADDNLFEAVPDVSFDLSLGRLPALDEAAFASDHARREGPNEFVTDPMRRAIVPEKPAAEAAPAVAPAAATAPAATVPPAKAEPVSVTVPVVLGRTQVTGGAPIRIVLEVRLKDD